MAHAGRPTRYTSQVCLRLNEYLITTGKEQTSLPTVEGFAIFLGVARDTLYEWAKKHPKFSDTLKDLMTRQAQQLIDDGIYGGKEVNATIVKLMLQNNHGMRERKDITSLGKELPAPILGGVSVHPNSGDSENKPTDEKN